MNEDDNKVLIKKTDQERALAAENKYFYNTDNELFNGK